MECWRLQQLAKDPSNIISSWSLDTNPSREFAHTINTTTSILPSFLDSSKPSNEKDLDRPSEFTETLFTMADAALKPEKDFSKEVDKQIPEAEQLAKVPNSATRLQGRP